MIEIKKGNEFLSPINSSLNGYLSKESFNYAISLISKIQNPVDRLETFNDYMNSIYLKSSKGETQPEVTDIIQKKEVSNQLADFLKTFGKNWESIKKSIPADKQCFFLDALTYARNSIKFDALKDTDFKFEKGKFIDLVNSLELDDQKEYFIQPKEIEKRELSQSDSANILSHFLHDQRKLKFLKEHWNDVPFPKKDVVKIVNSLNYDSNRLKFLTQRNVKFYNFTSVECLDIINRLQNESNKLKALKLFPIGDLKLNQDQIAKVISNFENDKDKLNFLNITALKKLLPDLCDISIRQVATKIACSLKEDKNKLRLLTPDKIKELGMRNFNIAFVATTLESDASKLDVIRRAKELKLNSKNISRIISSYQSDKPKIEYLDSTTTLGFTPSISEKAQVLSSLSSIGTLKKYLQNPDFQEYKYAILLGAYNNQSSVSTAQFDEIAEMAGINPKELHNLSIPTLPDKMTIGVELETVGIDDKGNSNTNLFREFRNVFGNFQAKRDISLHGYKDHSGVEIISPILMNHNLENLNLVAALLQKNNLDVNETCGAHVHIGADYLNTVEAWKNLCEIWGNNEDIMYQITNQTGTSLRNGVKEYARPLSPKIVKALQSGNIHLENEEDLDKFIDEVKHLQYGENQEFSHIISNHPEVVPTDCDFHKYYGLNFKNINSVNKNTIEFRLPNGTINPQTLMHNIRLFSSIVDVSKQLGDIEILLNNNQEQSLTAKQKRLYLARKALTSAKENDQRVIALMNLLFDDDEKSKDVFIQRYRDFPKDSIQDLKFDTFGYRKYKELKFDTFDYRSYYTSNYSKIPLAIREIMSRIGSPKKRTNIPSR